MTNVDYEISKYSLKIHMLCPYIKFLENKQHYKYVKKKLKRNIQVNKQNPSSKKKKKERKREREKTKEMEQFYDDLN